MSKIAPRKRKGTFSSTRKIATKLRIPIKVGNVIKKLREPKNRSKP